MDNIYKKLEPEKVFGFFAKISEIPRCSGNEKAISDYLVSFAKARGLRVIQDEAFNVVIEKSAYKGYENAPKVIIQGHMDMVCDKNRDKVHDFDKDTIELRVEEDMLFARDTTLGADNGIAIAYALAILDSEDIPHPPIKVLITVGEEVGLTGASALDPRLLDGDFLINIDSEEEGQLLASCAGGITAKQFVAIEWEDSWQDRDPYEIGIGGLRGGHSGVEIDKGRGNANKLMGRVLGDLQKRTDYRLCDIKGGTKMNAIPREAEAVILVDPGEEKRLKENISKWNMIFKNEFKTSDPEVSVTLSKLDAKTQRAFSKETCKRIIALLTLIPSGVQTMSMDIEGLVESSTNLGVVSTTETEVIFESGIRSSVGSLKQNILEQNSVIADVLGVRSAADSEYPEWEFDPDSKLRDIFVSTYKEMFGFEPDVIAVHGGLECGIFSRKNPNLDMVSFGPSMYDVHSPNEHVCISSVRRMWEYLLEVLKSIK